MGLFYFYIARKFQGSMVIALFTIPPAVKMTPALKPKVTVTMKFELLTTSLPGSTYITNVHKYIYKLGIEKETLSFVD